MASANVVLLADYRHRSSVSLASIRNAKSGSFAGVF